MIYEYKTLHFRLTRNFESFTFLHFRLILLFSLFHRRIDVLTSLAQRLLIGQWCMILHIFSIMTMTTLNFDWKRIISICSIADWQRFQFNTKLILNWNYADEVLTCYIFVFYQSRILSIHDKVIVANDL